MRSRLLCVGLLLCSWLTGVAFSQPSPGSVVNISPNIAAGDVATFTDTSGVFLSNAPPGSIAGGLEGVLQWSSNTSVGVLFSNEVRITGGASWPSRLVLGHDSPIWMIGPYNVISNVLKMGGSDFDAAATDFHALNLENRTWGRANGQLVLDVENGHIVWGGLTNLDLTLKHLKKSGAITVLDYEQQKLFDSAGVKVMDWGVGTRWDSGGNLSSSTELRKWYDAAGAAVGDWGVQSLIDGGSVVFSWDDNIALTAHRNLDMKGFSIINQGPGSSGFILESSPGVTNVFSIGVTNLDLVTGGAYTQLLFGIGSEKYGLLSSRNTNDWYVANTTVADEARSTDIQNNRRSISALQDNMIGVVFEVSEEHDLLNGSWVDMFGDVFNTSNQHVSVASMTNMSWSASKYMGSVRPGGYDTLTGLVFHDKMNDDAANTTVDESSVTDQDGVADRNTADFNVVGKIGGALDFAIASTDKVDHGDNAAWDNVTAATWAWWVKYDGALTTAYRTWAKWDGGGNRAWYHSIDPNNDRYSLQCGDGGQRHDLAVNSVTQSVWQHVMFTYDGVAGTISGFVNNAFSPPSFTSGSVPGSITPETAELWIGQFDSHTGYDMDGSLDDVRMYNRALGQVDRDTIYNGGSGTEAAATVVASTGDIFFQIEDSDWLMSADSDSVRVSALVQTNGDLSAIINTTVWVEVSANHGTNWTRVDLTDEGEFYSTPGIVMWRGSSNDLSIGRSAKMRWRGTNLNENGIHIYAAGMLFDKQ